VPRRILCIRFAGLVGGLGAALVAVVVPAQDGQLKFSDAWVRATPPGVVTAAGYVAIDNSGADDRLVAVRSARAKSVELHTTVDERGMLIMKPLDGLPVPGGAATELAPGGDHMMFVGIDRAFVPGETVVVTLVFELAGARDVTFTVRDARRSRQ
jgi:copper(I)-binding protein